MSSPSPTSNLANPRAKDLDRERMKRLTIIALGALALSGCTGAHISKPAVCDGRHRRPANLYGSILPTLPVPLPASQQQAGQSMVVPGPGPEVLPAPPKAPALPPAPAPDSSPSAGSPAVVPSPSRASDAARPVPRTSQRDIALSYASC